MTILFTHRDVVPDPYDFLSRGIYIQKWCVIFMMLSWSLIVSWRWNCMFFCQLETRGLFKTRIIFPVRFGCYTEILNDMFCCSSQMSLAYSNVTCHHKCQIWSSTSWQGMFEDTPKGCSQVFKTDILSSKGIQQNVVILRWFFLGK